MAKGLKLNIKNVQLAKAVDLDNIKANIKKKSTKKKADTTGKTKKTATATATKKKTVKKEVKKPIEKAVETKIEEQVEEKVEVKIEEPKKEKVKKPKTIEETQKQLTPEEIKARFSKPKPKPEPEKPKPVKKISEGDIKKEDMLEKFGSKKPPKKEKQTRYKGYQDIKSLHQYKGPKHLQSRKQRYGKRSKFREAATKQAGQQTITTVRPSSLKIRLPISIKDLASEMKIKSSELIGKLFMHGVICTINDCLDDETTIQLAGQEFDCEITIDTSEEKLLQITDKTIEEEIKETDPQLLESRAPIVAFMGHVDHGKTSLIDVIRNSNIVAGEKGAITQHIGAFRYITDHGTLTIIDTPGHEAFTAMRKRGAHVTDIVILVVAGDEGVKDQTIEAINHARDAGATIIVAINKSDKAGFNAENVYRQLADQKLLPEAWGGDIVTVNCSATTKEGVNDLLEMIILQSEVIELKANTKERARGIVLESALHTGFGVIATVLVQNGTLKYNDAIVFDNTWGRVKTMHDEFGKNLQEAAPSMPVRITGLENVPKAGEEFIIVGNEKEARKISEMRLEGKSTVNYRKVSKMFSAESLLQKSEQLKKKILNIILRTDVHGSLEALKTCLLAIESEKVDVNIISADVGEISESDIELAEASNAIIIGFQTSVESHAADLIKEKKITILLHGVIYHVIDDVKYHMKMLLDKIPQENEKGEAKVQATFKSSQFGNIAGCLITKGSIHRNHLIRIVRGDEIVWKGRIASIRKEKDSISEIMKDNECGIVLDGFNNVKEEDILQAYEVNYIEQEL